MKREFDTMPETFQEVWPGEFESFSWQDFLTAIPSPLFLVTTYKSNGKENACMQSWSTFVGSDGEFLCLLGSVSKSGHLYRTLRERNCCVVNFMSRGNYSRCLATIQSNGFDDDEITAAGLTAERAASVDAPRVQECFLNLECEFLWEHEHFESSSGVTIALRVKHLCMDDSKWNGETGGRYGKDGFLYNIHSPRNPETGAVQEDALGFLQLL